MNGSLLYRDGADFTEFGGDDFYRDLRLDAVLAEIAGAGGIDGRYRQKPAKLGDVQFRQAVLYDLERPEIRKIAEDFTNRYCQYQTCLAYARDLPQRQTRQKWLLDGACAFCGCVVGLHDSLAKAVPRSEGFRRFLGCLDEYIRSEQFAALNRDAGRCAERLSDVRYTLDVWLYQNKVAVKAGDGCAEDYCARLASVFRRFDVDDSYRMVPFPGVNMEALELAVLDRLCELFPGEFALLGDFCARHPAAGADLIDTFASELRFYQRHIAYMDRMRQRGYAFSQPAFCQRRAVSIAGGYDLSLAQAAATTPVTPNDFDLEAGQSCIVTGPNQGGKTACLRMVGQIAYFASLGLPAPCRHAELYFIGGIYTHFAREEDLSNHYGRLKEELQRARRILDGMPPGSVILFNDLFSSTTAFDAAQIGRLLLDRLSAHGCLCLFATNLQELAETGKGPVLHAAPDDGGAYRLMPPPSGQAFAGRRLAAHLLRRQDIRSRVK